MRLLTRSSYSLGGDLELEDRKFATFLAANGWTGEVGADASVEALVADEKAAEVE